MSWKEEYAKRYAYILMLVHVGNDVLRLKPCRFVGSTLLEPRPRKPDFDIHIGDPLAALCGINPLRPIEVRHDFAELRLREFRSGPLLVAVYVNLAPGEWLCQMVDEYLAPPRLVRALDACARWMMKRRGGGK